MRIRSALWTLAILALSHGIALADKRVALVMGNSAYQSVTPLSNPSNDADAIAATFKAAGFDVVDLKRDLNLSEMRRALRDFSDSVVGADVAVVYYAGHGMEIEGTNYVIPTDAVLQRDLDAFDEAIPLDRILTVIEPAKQLRLVILDACRDNPFNRTMKRTIGSRAISRGLARVDPSSPNTLVAFAAKAGSTASDGDSKNSPYTTALVKYLPKPGLDLRKALGFTRDEVLKVTNNKQEPFMYGSLGGEDIALVPAIIVAAPFAAAGSSAPDESIIRRDYELSLQIGTREAWDYFTANYPNSFYSKLAQAQRNKLAAEETRLAATEKAKSAQDEQTRLAIEGAKAAEQAKAAVQAKAAEQARVAAELAKKAEESKVAVAERAKTAALAKASEDERTAAGAIANAKNVKPNSLPLAAASVEPTKPSLLIQEATVTPELLRAGEKAPLSDRGVLREIRERLYELNFDPGPFDGPLDEAIRQSIREFEIGSQLPQTGEPTIDLLRRLRSAGELKPWGALVYAKGTDKWGLSWGQASRRLAVASARSSCSDAKICQVELSFFGNQCGSFAHSPTTFSIISRANVQNARDAALADCGKRGKLCRTIASVCADGSGLKTANERN